MNAGRYIAGDWGTTRLRLFLCDGKRVLDTREGAGIAALARSPAAEFLALVEPWITAQAPTHAVLCGMVGSRNGWRETAYVSCPAALSDLCGARAEMSVSQLCVAIVPGLVCAAPLGAPDVMRGEETQIFGALQLQGELARGRHLLALPGTHTKWVVIEDGCIVNFQTALTGEVFALLREHSMLMRVAPGSAQEAGADDADEEGFARGLEAGGERGAVVLLQRLFEVRSRQLIDEVPQGWALGFLSGLLISADVDGALALFGPGSRGTDASATAAPATVSLVGAQALTARYSRALQARGIEAACLDGNECVLAGLQALALLREQ